MISTDQRTAEDIARTYLQSAIADTLHFTAKTRYELEHVGDAPPAGLWQRIVACIGSCSQWWLRALSAVLTAVGAIQVCIGVALLFEERDANLVRRDRRLRPFVLNFPTQRPITSRALTRNALRLPPSHPHSTTTTTNNNNNTRSPPLPSRRRTSRASRAVLCRPRCRKLLA